MERPFTVQVMPGERHLSGTYSYIAIPTGEKPDNAVRFVRSTLYLVLDTGSPRLTVDWGIGAGHEADCVPVCSWCADPGLSRSGVIML